MALLLERRIYAVEDEPGIVLLSDRRQINQICAVDRTLKSIETSEGHGDAFWSNALMCRAAADGPGITVLGNINEIWGRRPPGVPSGRVP